jgi:hypothetical protein
MTNTFRFVVLIGAAAAAFSTAAQAGGKTGVDPTATAKKDKSAAAKDKRHVKGPEKPYMKGPEKPTSSTSGDKKASRTGTDIQGIEAQGGVFEGQP